MAAILERCGILLSPSQTELLWSYHQFLREHNPELNLTRIHQFDNMVVKLYADSILPGQFIDLPSPLLDLGTGPGMPGIPLKIAYPHLQILLAESRQKRVAFLEAVSEKLNIEGLDIIGKAIGPEFQQPVSGVITRAVEPMEQTLDHIGGCLVQGGLAIFMKGPNCDPEIEAVLHRFHRDYKLVRNHPYRIPHTSHSRRLVVFQRLDQPITSRKADAMQRHSLRKIESEHNEIFRDLKKLLTARGIKKQQRAVVSGSKQVEEILRHFPDACEAWISTGDQPPPPLNAPAHLSWYELAAPLFHVLDSFGTRSPLLVVRTQPMGTWNPEMGFPEGCSVLVPFQDPENVGAVIRSAVAFGATRVILLKESAHPYHPKAIRASGGAVLHATLMEGPSLNDLSADLPLVPLSSEGEEISSLAFPAAFGLLAGLEGSGLPDHLRHRAVSISVGPEVESLNAAVATGIALYVWSEYARKKRLAGE